MPQPVPPVYSCAVCGKKTTPTYRARGLCLPCWNRLRRKAKNARKDRDAKNAWDSLVDYALRSLRGQEMRFLLVSILLILVGCSTYRYALSTTTMGEKGSLQTSEVWSVESHGPLTREDVAGILQRSLP